MNHEIALAKYNRLGINNNMLLWLRSYLVGRTMAVKIGDHVSLPFTVTSGVPQGSHLGPFLFLLYMNDINSVLSCQKLSYADDLKLFHVIDAPNDALFLQSQLEIFANWCRINSMSLNVTKCSIISFSRKRIQFNYDYSLNATSLKRESNVKDLGVILDTKLSFKHHINFIVSKASSKLGFIFRFAKKFKNVYCLKTLYTSLVRPILECSVVEWSAYYQNGIRRIESVQRKFMLYALRHLPWRDRFNLPSYEHRCRLINLEPLEKRRNVAKACFVADLLQGHIDCSMLLGLLDINTRRRNLRAHTFFNNLAARTNYGLHEPVRSMCRAFNRCYSVFDFHLSRIVNKSRFRRILC